MLRKLVLSHSFLHRKAFPVRAQSLLRIKVDEPARKHKESSSTSIPSKAAKAVRKRVVVRRSTASPAFRAEKVTEAASLAKGLNCILREYSLSASQRSQITAVLTQLRRHAPAPAAAAAQVDGTTAEEEMLRASRFMHRVSAWNAEMAAYIDTSVFGGKSALRPYFMAMKMRETLDFETVMQGRTICSDDVYNALLRALAAVGRSVEAVKVLGWMREDGMKPTYKCYAAVLEGMGHELSMSDFESEVKLIEEMKADGHALEDLLLIDDYSHESLLNMLKVLFRVMPALELKPKKVDREAERYELFPVLQRYHQSRVSKNNPLFGTLSNEELSEGFEKQLQVEQAGFMEIEPIAELKVDVSPEKRRLLRELLLKEREAWRSVLTAALNNVLQSGQLRRNTLLSIISVLPVDECVNVMLNEIDYLVSESITQFTHSSWSFRRLGDSLYQVYMQMSRQKEKHADKLEAIYKDYMPRTIGSRTRNQKLTNLADTWETVAAPHLKGDSLNLKIPEWNDNITFRIGAQLHRLMHTNLKFDTKALSSLSKREEAPLMYESLEQQGDKLQKFIKIHPVMLRWFNLAGLPPLRFPASKLPMLCPPVPWVNPERQSFAGFLFSQDHASKLIRNKTSKGQRLGAFYLADVRRREFSPVLDALNVLSAVAWRVNRPLLDVVTQVFKAGGDRQLLRRLSIPLAPHNLPAPPPMPDPSLPFTERSAAMKALEEAQKERNQMYSLWYTDLYRLSIANKFRDNVFWLPHSMDFRGRVYPCPPHFNYMGSDISRSLLVFAKGRRLGPNGLDWLMIHLVNLTGLKKRASNKERLSFANTILDEILDSSDRPLDGRGWWMQQEEPWQVLACCMEIAKAKRAPDHRNYVSHFPVHQDGSCNGLQHYAALGRDILGADCVNLTPRENPQDVYADVGELVEKQRQLDAGAGLQIAQQLEGYVRRKVIKQSVMTTVYGVTFFGAQQQIARQLREFEEFPPELVKEASEYLARLTLDSIGKIFTSSVKIQDWLVASARAITSKRRIRVGWKTPLGLPVMQPYTKDFHPNKVVIGDVTMPDVAKQARAFPPNFVHSLDATHMVLTALSCYRRGITFSAVHDCFWTHAADVPSLGAVCREQFVALHEQPLLQDLAESLIESFGSREGDGLAEVEADITLRSVPSRGYLNIKTVLDSEYFFS